MPQTYYLLASILASQGDHAGALEYATEGVQRFPQNQGLWVTRAQIDGQRGDLDAARRALDRALSLPGKDPRIPALRARLRR